MGSKIGGPGECNVFITLFFFCIAQKYISRTAGSTWKIYLSVGNLKLNWRTEQMNIGKGTSGIQEEGYNVGRQIDKYFIT